jgi:hypothetical protein
MKSYQIFVLLQILRQNIGLEVLLNQIFKYWNTR